MPARLAVDALALVLVAGSYAAARLPEPSGAARAAEAARFRFEPQAIPRMTDRPLRSIRAVHPSLAHIDGWISSVGAGIGVADLDGDGLSNDICHVDPRVDEVIVSSAAGAYAMFGLPLNDVRMDRTRMAPMGCLPGDLDEDGRLDLVVYFWGRPPVAFYYRAAGEGSFGPGDFESREIVSSTDAWYSNAATRADVDGDGHTDLVIGNYFPDGAGVLDRDGSGVVAMQASMSRAANGGGIRFLRWISRDDRTGNVRFEERRPPLPDAARRGWVLAIAAADLDADLLPEIYVANDFGPDALLHNGSAAGALRFQPVHGRRDISTPASHVLGFDSFKGMGADFGDIDADGRVDLFVSNIASPFALLESHLAFLGVDAPHAMRAGVAPFVERSEALGLSRSGWAWDAKIEDFDADGQVEIAQSLGFLRGRVSRWPELQELATANDQVLADPRIWPRFGANDDLNGREHLAFFVRHADGRFHDLADALAVTGNAVSRGIAPADIDGDGRMDLAIASQWGDSVILRNRGGARGAFLGLRLRRARPGIPFRTEPGLAIPSAATPLVGATARVMLPDGRRFERTSDGGNGHSGKRSGDIHFGVGPRVSTEPLHVELSWRDADGLVRRRVVSLRAGWHTVTLGH
jgi:enediyne biosynthesis protein E4